MDLVNRHSKNQEKIGTSWRTALKEVRENLHRKYREKKNTIKEQIHKLLANESKTFEELLNFEKERSVEVLKLAADLKNKDPSNESLRTVELKNQQLNNIWSETCRELNVVLERQRERLNRLDENLKSARLTPMSTSAQNLTALRDQRNSIHNLRTNNVN